MAQSLLWDINVQEFFPAVDMTTGANTGDWLSLENYKGCIILLHAGLGTAGDDPVMTLQQATDAAGTGAKTLALPAGSNRVWDKQAATSHASTGTFSVVAATDAKITTTAGDYTGNATSAEQDLIVLIDIHAEDLDVDNDFTFIQASVADVGAASQPGTCLGLFYGARFAEEGGISVVA